MDSQGGEIFETGRSGTIAQMSVRVGLKVAGLLAIDEGYEHIPVISCDHFGSQCGAVTFVQRYGDALNANPHFHCLCIDGVYAAGSDGRPEFHQLPAPEDEDAACDHASEIDLNAPTPTQQWTVPVVDAVPVIVLRETRFSKRVTVVDYKERREMVELGLPLKGLLTNRFDVKF